MILMWVVKRIFDCQKLFTEMTLPSGSGGGNFVKVQVLRRRRGYPHKKQRESKAFPLFFIRIEKANLRALFCFLLFDFVLTPQNAEEKTFPRFSLYS